MNERNNKWFKYVEKDCKKVKFVAMLLVVAIMGGVIYNTGVTKKSKADVIDKNQVSVNEEIDYSMIDEDIKDIEVLNNIDGSIEAVVYYFDGRKDVAIADTVRNTVKTDIYDKNNSIVCSDVMEVDFSAFSEDNVHKQDNSIKNEETNVGNGNITRKSPKKLPAPTETATHLTWKLNKKQANTFILMVNAAAALVTLVATIAGAIALCTGLPVFGKISVWAYVIGAAFWCTSAFAQLQQHLNGDGKLKVKIRKSDYFVSFS